MTIPDIADLIRQGASTPWLYLPVAIVLGALHALEPGHAKSLMAAYIVSIKGTAGQAALLGVSAAVGHTIVVWILAVAGLLLGNRLIVEQAEPWLMLLSGVLIVMLAVRMFWSLRKRHAHGHGHDHGHSHGHGHDHSRHHHGHAPAATRTSDILWFGFTGGLLPCPAAIAVLLVCIQLQQFALGVLMVAAFSAGLAATLVLIGVAASWGTRKASARWDGFDALAARLPYLSAAVVLAIGVVMSAAGLNATGLLGQIRKPN
jgi:nickel/cobalt exporter